MKIFLLLILIYFSSIFRVFSQNIVDIAPSLGIEHTVNTQLLFGGHGVSFFDFDNDGWDDISFVQEDDSLVFYKNINGTLSSIPSFIYTDGETRQVLWADYDNDGDYDLFVTATNGLMHLFENDGNFNFSDVTQQAGFSQFIANNYGVSLADYNKDGHLDVYVARYSMSGNEADESIINLLYRNNGDGTFTDVTSFAGVGDSVQPSFMGIWIDINKNSYPDLYVINDRVLWGNTLYLNNGDGTFTDFTTQTGLSMFGEDPMGVMVGDYNNNGNLDILLSNGGPPTKPPRLYTNNGNMTYTENAQNLGINVFDTFMCTWGGTWIDINNNTFQDFYLTNGFLMPAFGEVENYFFRNNAGLSFTLDNSIFSGDLVAASYSVAKGDIDNDGYADLVVQNAKEYNSFIWKNDYGPSYGNNYIKVTLEGTTSNRMAIGSWIEVFIGNTTLTHYTILGDNFISQNSQHHIFGLGSFNSVDSLIITYPSGHKDIHYNLNVNDHYYFTEGETLTASIVASSSGYLCAGDTVQLNLQVDSLTQIVWSNGEINDLISIDSSGIYYATLQSEHGIVYYSDTVELTFLPVPLLIEDITNVSCHGGNDGAITINEIPSHPHPYNSSILWMDNSGSFSLSDLTEGIYTYEYSTDYGCLLSGQVLIEAPSPIVVNVILHPDDGSQNGVIEYMIFGGKPPYQSYLNGDLVAGSPIDSLSHGVYNLMVVDANDCIYETTITIDNLLTTSELYNQTIRVFPNPNYGVYELYVGDEGKLSNSKLIVYDQQGRKVHQDVILPNETQKVVDNSFLKSGVYTLIVISETETHTFKIVIQN